MFLRFQSKLQTVDCGCVQLQLNSAHKTLQSVSTDKLLFMAFRHVRPGNGFVPNFLLFEKGDVNGQNEQEVFTFLKVSCCSCLYNNPFYWKICLIPWSFQNSCPPVGDSFGKLAGRLFWEPLKLTDIKWNFEKFLVGPDGKPVMRWHPSVNVSTVRAYIHNYLLQQLLS